MAQKSGATDDTCIFTDMEKLRNEPMRSARQFKRLEFKVQSADARSLREREEVLQDGPAFLGEDAFGMKLHAPNGQRLVPNAHDLFFIRLSRDLQAIGQGVALDDE